ncbi:MAG: hypothetical protein BKP49_10970 [Treponema sp. CETP13]|nr:MAG: hypothetical protein BKP49_10970 [Treponema sp. CETP13]
MITLRVHHLLCQGFYTGNGYSPEFVKNMDAIIAKLGCKDEEIQLTTQCDDICEGCPNRSTEDDSVCLLNANRVHIKDIMLLHSLKLTSREIYTTKKLGKLIEQGFSKEIFENSCKSCDWYRDGICKFERWNNRIGIN